jgi:hypothetical protein
MPLTTRRLLAVALVTTVASSLFIGCSSDDSSGGTGTAGTGGSSTGLAGTGGDTGSAGEEGDAGSDSGTAGSDGGTAGTDGGTAGTDGGTAGTDGGTAGTDGGTAGTGGSSGDSFPTTCEDSHGDVGCCGSDKLLYWFEHGQVIEVECEAGTVCGWDADGEFYDCITGSKTVEDPSKTFPAACFGPAIEGQGLCGPECVSDDDCDGNGYGSVCDTGTGLCGCSKDADCAGNPNGSICDAETKSCGCTKDAECPDSDYPVCGDFGGCDES